MLLGDRFIKKQFLSTKIKIYTPKGFEVLALGSENF